MPSDNTDNDVIRPDVQLDQSYRLARYTVLLSSREVHFRIGQRCVELETCLGRRGVTSACFLTAANPGSVLQSDETNSSAHKELIESIERAGYPWLPGVASDPAGNWPEESSVLVPGMDYEVALKLGRRFGQNALVWIDASGLPTLLWVSGQTGPQPEETG